MESENVQKKVVMTAAQPTGKLHLGNYLGAIKNWGQMIEDYECYFGIVDMHAITIPYVPADLKRNVYDCAAQYMACGLDPQKCNLFLQSMVKGHAELAWILGCICPIGSLERMTQYKDKAKKHKDALNSGLLYYPVLMASDILIYNADLVPVGEDQKQHLELNKPGVSNLMSIMAAFTQKTYGQIEDEFSGKGYGDFKKAVAEVVIESLAPVRQSYKDYSSDKAMIEDAIKKGSQAATRRTTKMMAKVYRKVGFLNFEK